MTLRPITGTHGEDLHQVSVEEPLESDLRKTSLTEVVEIGAGGCGGISRLVEYKVLRRLDPVNLEHGKEY